MMKENEYYSAENKVLPYKWVALEVIKYGKFSLMSGKSFPQSSQTKNNKNNNIIKIIKNSTINKK